MNDDAKKLAESVLEAAKESAERSAAWHARPCEQCFKPFSASGYGDRFCPACVTERGLELERLKRIQQHQLDQQETQLELDNLRRKVLETQLVSHELYVKELANVAAHRARVERINLMLVRATSPNLDGISEMERELTERKTA